MKFTQSILGLTILAIAFSSCSKDKTIIPTPTPVVPVSNQVAVLKFNNSLSDSAGKISVSTIVGVPTYVNDRNGNANGALYLNGSAKVEYMGVPFKGTAVTMSVWVKFDGPSAGLQHFVTAMYGNGGPTLFQSAEALGSSVSVPGTNSAYGSTVDHNWHHLAMTYDGKDIKIYFDGTLNATQNHPGSMGDDARTLVLGGFSSYFWTGYLDDLRIYNIAMDAAAIKNLAAL